MQSLKYMILSTILHVCVCVCVCVEGGGGGELCGGIENLLAEGPF